MTEHELKQVLKQQTEIPDVVEKSISETLQRITDSEKNRKKGRKNRKARSYFRMTGLAAALCAIAGVSVYAAVQYFDILDYVAEKNIKISEFWNKRNIEDTERIEHLADGNLTGTGMENEYAVYTVCEIRNDGELIHALFEVTPKGEYLVVPQDCMEEDYIQCLLPEELPDEMKNLTLKEYTAANEKELLLTGVSLFGNESIVSNSVDYFMSEDGTGYFYITAPVAGGFDSEIRLKAVGTARRSNDTVAGRCETELEVFNESTAEKTVYLPESQDDLAELGIELQKVEIKETALGLYAAFCYSLEYNDNSPNEIDGSMTIDLISDHGTRLKRMPYYAGSGRVKTENGFMQTNAYQKEEEITEYSVVIWNYETGTEYGTVKLKKE